MLSWLADVPIPPIAPGLVPKSVGPNGQWIIPGLIVAVSLALDWTAFGAAARRDRVAACLTYSAALAFIGIFKLAPSIQAIPGKDWSWLLLGSAISLGAHIIFLIVMIGPWINKIKPQAARLSHFLGIAIGTGSKSLPAVVPRAAIASGRGSQGVSSGEPTVNMSGVGKINTKLHMYATLAATTYPLARGPSSWIPEHIGLGLTTASGMVTQQFVHWLGG